MALRLDSQLGSEDILTAVLLVGVPIVDTALVVISRLRRRVSVIKGARDHLSHRLLTWLPSARAAGLILAALQLTWSTLAVVATELGRAQVEATAIAFVLFAAVTIGFFETSAWARPHRQPAS
jgi:UDP-GlcNAc:undecaprenyl-phosphate GlcNAc-1-phosphate transferase